MLRYEWLKFPHRNVWLCEADGEPVGVVLLDSTSYRWRAVPPDGVESYGVAATLADAKRQVAQSLAGLKIAEVSR